MNQHIGVLLQAGGGAHGDRQQVRDLAASRIATSFTFIVVSKAIHAILSHIGLHQITVETIEAGYHMTT